MKLTLTIALLIASALFMTLTKWELDTTIRYYSLTSPDPLITERLREARLSLEDRILVWNANLKGRTEYGQF